jgi:hypothetical protein
MVLRCRDGGRSATATFRWSHDCICIDYAKDASGPMEDVQTTLTMLGSSFEQLLSVLPSCLFMCKNPFAYRHLNTLWCCYIKCVENYCNSLRSYVSQRQRLSNPPFDQELEVLVSTLSALIIDGLQDSAVFLRRLFQMGILFPSQANVFEQALLQAQDAHVTDQIRDLMMISFCKIIYTRSFFTSHRLKKQNALFDIFAKLKPIPLFVDWKHI